jgi:hypothetical protein
MAPFFSLIATLRNCLIINDSSLISSSSTLSASSARGGNVTCTNGGSRHTYHRRLDFLQICRPVSSAYGECRLDRPWRIRHRHAELMRWAGGYSISSFKPG